MDSMQAFYDRLFSGAEPADAYLLSLARLAQASLAQLAALQSNLAWETWSAETK
jgi:hypothetical protein